MNVIFIVADTVRRDHLGCYGNPRVHTPSLDALASRAVRFDRYYAAGFPTVPARANYLTGRWNFTYMGWEPFAPDEVTIGQVLSEAGYHAAAFVDTPFYVRLGLNYDRGFDTFRWILGQWGAVFGRAGEAFDLRKNWRMEADRCAPQTITAAIEWLEQHWQERFFLYIDLWDPHEPWDAPAYYTQRYAQDYDGEVILPAYGYWYEAPWLTEEKVRKGHATYCGELTMVDRWIGHLLSLVESMGLMASTSIIFTGDHGFCFGEHGGWFGKLFRTKGPAGSLLPMYEPGWRITRTPLYEEIIRIPLLIYVPGVGPRVCTGLTSAVDLMPTVLDLVGVPAPPRVQGQSLLPMMTGDGAGREFVVSSPPLVRVPVTEQMGLNVVQNLCDAELATITSDEWSLLYGHAGSPAELYNLKTDPGQADNVIGRYSDVAKALHRSYVSFLRECEVSDDILRPRLRIQPDGVANRLPRRESEG